MQQIAVAKTPQKRGIARGAKAHIVFLIIQKRHIFSFGIQFDINRDTRVLER